MMKRFLTFLFLVLSFGFSLAAQNVLNQDCDAIVGTYEVFHQGEKAHVQITKETDGSYRARVIWVEDRLDKKGNVRLDEKNPDKSLRHVECDNIVLFSGLKYDEAKCRWSGCKLYDPTRGIRANMVCEFQPDGTLRVKGSLLGFSQSIYWKKL